ncbi:hypothetical protein [Dyella jiangningensis]|uniref:Lipoprotein n=1 Tax=Dyella jiangningensis TaxID=1379159 RepID=A0A328P0V5_9GAMM|nr:hypothetical protein [Dyella jiangningensis]RAO75828.1 hypothetical protein CA260_17515 [Dyella jiangningensis]
MKAAQSVAGAIVAGMLLTGCGVTNNHDTVIRDAVANRVFLYQTPGANDATVQVVRANGYFGGGCSSQILIDDKFAAQLETGEQVSFSVPSGSHVVTLQNSGACHKPGSDAQVQTTLAAGETTQLAVNKWGSSLSQVKR